MSAALFEKGTRRKVGRTRSWWFDGREFAEIRTFKDMMAISMYICLINTIGYWDCRRVAQTAIIMNNNGIFVSISRNVQNCFQNLN